MNNKYKRREVLFFPSRMLWLKGPKPDRIMFLLRLVSFKHIYTQIKTEAYIVNNVSRFLRCMTIEFLVFQISPSQFKKSNMIFVEKYVSCASCASE